MPAAQRASLASAFTEEVGGVGGQVHVPIAVAGGPEDLDRFDAGRLAQSEVEPVVAGREEAAAAALGDLAAAPGGERHPRADGIAVGAALIGTAGEGDHTPQRRNGGAKR